MDVRLGFGGLDAPSESLSIFKNKRRVTTSPGRHGGCKEDKDEQSSLPGVEWNFTTFVQTKFGKVCHLW